jgi:hypothetical protein
VGPPRLRCRHGRQLCSECIFATDEAKRAFDIIRSYAVFVPFDERIRSWVALRLADGGSDGTLYLSKRDAVRHQSDEFLCAYFSYRGAPNGFASVKDAAIFLEWHRQAYDNGYRLPDPDAASGGPELIMPTPKEQVQLQLARFRELPRGR